MVAERLVIVTESTKQTKAGFAMAVISIELETNKTQAENCWQLAVQLHPVELHGKVGQIYCKSHRSACRIFEHFSLCCFSEWNFDVLLLPGEKEGNVTP